MPKKYLGSIIDLFEQRIDFEPNSGCWLWSAAVSEDGYGKLCINRRHVLAHRFSYLTYRGVFPAHLLVCHRCDVRSCVNPDHLFIGTHQDNMDDCKKKGRFAYLPGEKSNYVKLTAEKVLAIRADTRTLKEIAKDYGIASGYISTLKAGRTWKHLQ